MNYDYGNNNYNSFNNYNMNTNNNSFNQNSHQNILNINPNLSMNNFYNNNPTNILLQYINILNSNNTTNTNYLNTANIFQFMPNIIKFGFNPPYTLQNTKKEKKIIHPSDFKNKLHYKNTNNNNDIYDNNDSNERKFMRKMTKAEKIEIDKWFEARKKLYPTKKNIELKQKLGEIKVEKGLVSNLELKLRKKVNILKKLNSTKRKTIRNNFNKEFPNFQKRKKEILELNNKDNNNTNDNKEEDKNNKTNENQNIQIDNNIKQENILEEGEILDEIKPSENGIENNKENKQNFIGKKRERRMNNINKKFIKNKKFNKENKNEIGFKKGFKYKKNNLYDELIKKDKIKEQNILLQAIRYLINIKEEI